ncbi:MAG: DNA-binding response regulator [Thalassobius sp.]|nr:DNA-binding response regulator [Thalassovita sp.]
MIKYLIIDDEPIAHDIIQGYCDMLPNLQLQGKCYDALEALNFLSKHRVDLVFLDLNLPKLKGFDFLRTLSNPPKIIVTTAYKEHALEGYELNVVDYLLKPFGFERFLMAINKVVNTAKPSQQNVVSTSNSAKSVFLKTNKKYIQVNIDSILYLEAAGNYTKIFTTEEMIMIRDKISDLLTTLEHEDLIQIHKSFVVAKKHIKSIEGNRVFIKDYEIPIGKTYKSQINQLFN